MPLVETIYRFLVPLVVRDLNSYKKASIHTILMQKHIIYNPELMIVSRYGHGHYRSRVTSPTIVSFTSLFGHRKTTQKA